MAPEMYADGPIEVLDSFPPNQISILSLYVRMPNVAVPFLKKMLETARAEKVKRVILVCYEEGETERLGFRGENQLDDIVWKKLNSRGVDVEIVEPQNW